LSIAITIAKRIAFNKQQSFSRFIIRLSIAATALSVAAMIMTLAFVNGFEKTVSEKVFSFWGHIRVQHYENAKNLISEETPIDKNDTVLRIISQQPFFKSVQAFATKSAVLEKNKEIEGVLFKGVEANYDSVTFRQFLKQGRWLHLGDSSYAKEIIVSMPMAKALQIAVNDTISIHFISQDASSANATRKLVVVGIFNTGIEEYDKIFAVGDLRLIQRLNNWQPNQIGGYEILMSDYSKMNAFNAQLKDQLPTEWLSRTIKETYPNIFDWLNVQDTNKYVVFIIMGIVAIINLVTCLLILVLERTRMIGILKAIGATNTTIQEIFLYYASFISLAGIGLGLVIGVGLCLLQQTTHFIHMDEALYYVPYAPIHIIWWQVAMVCLVAAVVCFLSLIIPTLIVKNIKPVKAIQFR
jgi:lipoprotein-releasing system permease protein